MLVHEAIASELHSLQVDTMFGLIGDANLFMAQRFVDLGGRYVSAVHEANAVMMAHGYACRSGRLGIATVTQGPGLTNTLTALVEVVRARTPMVIITGDTVPGNPNHMQAIGQSAVIEAAGAQQILVDRPESSGPAVRRAVRLAVQGRRPVVLVCPTAFQWDEVPEQGPADTASFGQLDDERIDEEALEAAVGVIAAARRPLILAGRGIVDSGCGESVLALAERVGAPLATTLRARGLFGPKDGGVGVFGTLSDDVGTQIISDCDCVIALGAGLNTWTTAGGELLAGKSLVHIDVDADALARSAHPSAAVRADAGTAADACRRLLDAAGIPPSTFRTTAQHRLDNEELGWRPKSHEGFTLSVALHTVSRSLPAERTVAYDAGRFLGEAFKFFEVHRPETQVFSSAFGAIGLGMGAAIGAACAAADEITLLLTGDGGFMMSGLNELNSAVRAGLRLVVLVCNDGSYGAEYQQFVARGMDPALSLFSWPALSEVASALGCCGLTAHDEESLASAVATAVTQARPVLIDLKLDPSAVPAIQH